MMRKTETEKSQVWKMSIATVRSEKPLKYYGPLSAIPFPMYSRSITIGCTNDLKNSWSK